LKILASIMTSTKPRVLIVFTGGTISMRFDSKAGGAVPALSGREIIALVPGLEDVAEINTIDFARLPGPHMTPARMLELSAIVRRELLGDRLDGVVITHGTDTLEETAFLLDLALNFEKPVVFVGAMRNSSELGWDGPANLRSAVRVASSPEARGLGVLIVMNDQVLAAAEATKSHTDARETFQSRDSGPLGYVQADRVRMLHRRVAREHIPVDRLEDRVEIVKLASGSDGRLLRCAVEAGVRGLVIEGLGCGNVPVTAISETENAIKSGLPVVITTRCWRGPVLETYAYDGAAKQLRRIGAILGGNLPSHKARLKLMLLLAAGEDVEGIRRSFEC
jgi:L-asparaginase